MTGAAQVARGAGMTFLGYAGRVSRPIALALFARVYGLDALGVALVVWAWVEVVSRATGLGLDRGLQRYVPALAAPDRPPVVAAALMVVGVTSLVVGALLALVLPGGAAALVMLPAITVGVTALHAVRGTKQILALVWARSVIEPGMFLVGGLVLAPFADGPAAVLGAYMISLGALLACGLVALSRTFGLRTLVRARRAARAVPLRELLRFSLPLGLADILNLALQRGDVIAVGLLFHDPALTSGYAIAREIVTALSKVRQGFDQVLAPIAAELDAGRRHDELAQAAQLSARMGAVLAAPIALVLVVFPDAVLALFGVHHHGVSIALAVLAVGRFADVATGPTSVLLAMVGHPRLVLLDTVVGLAFAVGAGYVLGHALGVAGVALATGGGFVLANLLALYWLDRVARLRPVGASFATPAAAFAVTGLALVALRAAVGPALAPALFAGLAGWLALYVGVVAALGLLPTFREVT